MTPRRFYHVNRPEPGLQQVEAWSVTRCSSLASGVSGGRSRWRPTCMLRWPELAAMPGETLAGAYLSTDQAPCDAENRLFTNPGAAGFPNPDFSSGLGRDRRVDDEECS